MALKHFLIVFLSVFTLASSQSISCDFQVDFRGTYWCNLTIDNPEGVDRFSGINGIHMEGRNNDDVAEVYIRAAGTTLIIPRVICDVFPSLKAFVIYVDIGIQYLTENALSSCVNLIEMVTSYNPITEIHPNFLRNNINLDRVSFINVQVTSIPEELFSTTTKLTMMKIEDAPLLTDLPANLFKNTPLMYQLYLRDTGLSIWRAEWTQSMTQLSKLYFTNNNFPDVPRNALNSNEMEVLYAGPNQIQVLDYFMFNNLSSTIYIGFNQNPIEAVDFNFIDMATSLIVLFAYDWKCATGDFFDFPANREAYMAELEPCFAAFDSRTLTFSTSGTELTFNSIRKEFINLQVQAPSDAIIRFSSNPDGSGSNFEVQLGNTNSCIYENGVQRTCTATSGLLSDSQMTSFMIMWSGGFVYVMHGNPLMFNMLASPLNVRFYGVGTSGSSASWIIE